MSSVYLEKQLKKSSSKTLYSNTKNQCKISYQGSGVKFLNNGLDEALIEICKKTLGKNDNEIIIGMSDITAGDLKSFGKKLVDYITETRINLDIFHTEIDNIPFSATIDDVKNLTTELRISYPAILEAEYILANY